MDKLSLNWESWKQPTLDKTRQLPDDGQIEKSGQISISQEELRIFQETGQMPERIKDLWELDPVFFRQLLLDKAVEVY